MTRQMFADTNEDLPLFSGTPQRVPAPQAPDPQSADRQTRWAVCPVCLDTGVVVVRRKVRRCWCAKGDSINAPLFAVPTNGIANTDPLEMDDETFQAWIAVLPQSNDAERAKVNAWRSKRREQRDRLTLEALPQSKRLARVQRNAPDAYPEKQGGPLEDTEKILREATALDSPAMRFQSVGPLNLSIVELLSIILDEQTPLLASRIFTQFPTLPQMMNCTPHFLATIKGMTPRKVMRLQSALHLVSRRTDPVDQPIMIKCPQDIAEIVSPMMRGRDQEEMRVIALSTKNRIIGNVVAYQGSLHTTVIRVGELFRDAMMLNAAAIVVVHNHPSGDPAPSPEDVAVTREIVQAGKLLDIDVLDHLVIGNPGFVSLKERGLGFG